MLTSEQIGMMRVLAEAGPRTGGPLSRKESLALLDELDRLRADRADLDACRERVAGAVWRSTIEEWADLACYVRADPWPAVWCYASHDGSWVVSLGLAENVVTAGDKNDMDSAKLAAIDVAARLLWAMDPT